MCHACLLRRAAPRARHAEAIATLEVLRTRATLAGLDAHPCGRPARGRVQVAAPATAALAVVEARVAGARSSLPFGMGAWVLAVAEPLDAHRRMLACGVSRPTLGSGSRSSRMHFLRARCLDLRRRRRGRAVHHRDACDRDASQAREARHLPSVSNNRRAVRIRRSARPADRGPTAAAAASGRSRSECAKRRTPAGRGCSR